MKVLAFCRQLPVLLVFIAIGVVACSASCRNNMAESTATSGQNALPNGRNMKIKIGARTFTATLYDNAATAAFNALLPLKVDMIELNGNEKYAELPGPLPASASNPGTIQAGDLMLYCSSTLVLFYKTFPTSYRYTRLGRIADSAELAAAVGTGNVTVTFDRSGVSEKCCRVGKEQLLGSGQRFF